LEYRRTITIRSEPAGAGVFLNGRLVGETPLRVLLHDRRARQVRLIHRGRQDVESLIQPLINLAEEGTAAWAPHREEEELFFELPPEGESRLIVTSDPKGCEIVMDGRRLGTTPLSVAGLRSGRRRIHASRQGFTSAYQDVQLTPGGETRVHLALEDEIAAVYRSLIRKEPNNLNHYAELAHHFVLFDKFDEANEALEAGYAVLARGSAEQTERYVGELQRIYIRYFIYSEGEGAERIRNACRDIVERGIRETIGGERSMRNVLKRMESYDRAQAAAARREKR
jgi:hypothetical protein